MHGEYSQENAILALLPTALELKIDLIPCDMCVQSHYSQFSIGFHGTQM